jgi:flagellar M-ring protein FliF
MKDQIKKVKNDIVDFWKKLNKKTKIIIAGGLAAVIIISSAAAFLMNRGEYVALFSDISEEETVEVMKQLQENSVEYKYEDKTILIPAERENELRMQLAESGHPRTGSNYNLFTDSVDFMTTDYEKKTYKIFQLQDRLQDSIETIDGVNEALVTIYVPEEKSFAWETDKEESTASVKVNLAGGKSLTSSQVSGIIQLVSKSVQGLKEENIAIVDTNGNSLSPDSDTLQTNAIKLKLEVEKEFEKDTVNNVKSFLEKMYGTDNVQVSANCKINFDKKISEMLKYLPDDETKNGVPSETQNEREITGPGQTTGGVAGTESNAELSTYPGVTVQGDDIYFKDTSTINYLVSQLKEQIEYNPGNIEKLTVAVVINKKGMTEDEKNKVTDLVAFSAGIEKEHVALHNMEFYEDSVLPIIDTDPLETVPSLTRKLLIYGGIAAGSLALIALIILIVKKKKQKSSPEKGTTKKEEQNKQMDFSWADVQEEIKVQETQEQVIKKQLKDFTKNNPEITAQLIRTWLKGDEE